MSRVQESDKMAKIDLFSKIYPQLLTNGIRAELPEAYSSVLDCENVVYEVVEIVLRWESVILKK